jgi:hypothetical protein
MYDNEPKKIQREITRRDILGSDHFSVNINGFNDGQQDYRFYVSAAEFKWIVATRTVKIFLGMQFGTVKLRFWLVVEMKIPTPLYDSQNHKVKL